MPDRQRYLRQLRSGRDVGLVMTERQLQEYLRLLEQYADELASRVARGLATRDQRYALAVAREIIDDLTRELATSTRSGVTITARRVAEIHAAATAELAGEAGVTVQLSGAIGSRAARAVLARPELARSFRTIRRESVGAVDRILTRALVRNASNAAIERELRLHVLGADALPDRLLLDRRRIGYAAIRELGYEPNRENLLAVRKDAGKVVERARLIARTEPMNAEHEAHVLAAIESPVVAAIRWQLSHRHKHLDACDALADGDWYGLGPGLYDPRRVPPRPHPRCLCILLNELRAVADWGKPRPDVPGRKGDVEEIGELLELYPSQIAALQAALDVADGRILRVAA